MSTAEEKVPGGKLVRVSIDRAGGRQTVQLSGDFFVHPEEAVCLIEAALGRLEPGTPEAQVVEALEAIVNDHHIELIGFDVQTIARLYKRCHACGE